MEAGYDYLLANRRFRLVRLILSKIRQNPLPYAGAALVVLGLTGVVIGSLFFFVFAKSTDELQDELSAVAPPAAEASGELSLAREEDAKPASPPIAASFPAGQEAAEPSSSPVSELSPELAKQAGLFPGEDLKPGVWHDPIVHTPDQSIGDLIGGFTSVDPAMVASVGQLPIPTKLFIPSIDVESDVKQLRVLNFGNSVSWETPDNVVGHIPVTANPGEAGSTWLFGHLESPILGEGNVFGQLPELPAMIRRGDDIYAVVDNGDEQYLYRIVESKVVPQSELKLTDDGTPQLFMVTCVPRFVYDHRLVVRGVLEGVKG